MENRVYISELLDLYGKLLTEKQRDTMQLYYNDDLSLAEISEITNTSRQAIFDLLKRCEKMIFDYESKLKLLDDRKMLINKKKLLLQKIKVLKKNNIENISVIDSIEREIEDLI